MSVGGKNPFDLPEWHALRRESSLVSQLLGAGVTALGRASYADGMGEYYTAFFGLSIGMERLCKLILLVEHAIDSGGAVPNSGVLRSYGHKLSQLVDKAEQISAKHKFDLKRPVSDISRAVIDCLDSFSEASKGRYANFEAIGNPAFKASEEPVAKWWRDVAKLILAKHYKGQKSEAIVKAKAQLGEALVGVHSVVLLHDETGRLMSDIATSAERMGATKKIQEYGRFYTLEVVRWLAEIFSRLCHLAAHGKGYAIFAGHEEFFAGYRVDDSFLRSRKNWPLR